MSPLTREWIEKADADFAAVLILARTRRPGFRDAICFHCQQCAEKFLKARLQEAGLPVPRTHDLDALLDLLLPVEPLWAALRPALSDLSNYAVSVRYPGDTASAEEAAAARRNARVVRRIVRRSLGAVR